MRLRTVRLALVLGLAAWAGAVAAQPTATPGPPVPLVKPDREKPAPPPAEPAKPTEAAPAGVEATNLAPPDTSWQGAVPEGTPPLPGNMWQGTSRLLLRRAMSVLGPSDSPALQSLSRRLLLSAAVPPAGDDPEGEPSLADLRIERLVAIGAFAGARALLDQIPTEKRRESQDKKRVELGFALGDVASACRQVAEGIAKNDNVWWDRAQIACQLLLGKRKEAALALEVLHDHDAPADPAFDLLIAAASFEPAKLDKTIELSPLRATLWAASRRPLPESMIESADLASLAAFAGVETAPAHNRLAAAERAARLGAFPIEKLGELYKKVEFKDEERAIALTDPKFGETARGRALLYAVAVDENDPSHRAEALTRFIDAEGAHGLFFVAGRLAAPIIAKLAPGDATPATASAFVRALLAADKADAIEPWLSPGVREQMWGLLLLTQVLDRSKSSPDAKAMNDELELLLPSAAASAPRKIAIFEMIENEFAAPLSPEQLAGQLLPVRQSEMPSLALWLAQEQAAKEHRVGETALTSILLLTAAKQHLTTEPVVLRRALGGLRAAGFEAEARSLALEATLDAGL